MITKLAPVKHKTSTNHSTSPEQVQIEPIPEVAEIAKLRLLDLQSDPQSHRFLASLPKTFARELAGSIHRSLFYSIEALHYMEKEFITSHSRTSHEVELNMAIKGKEHADRQLGEFLTQIIGFNRYSNCFATLCDYMNKSLEFTGLLSDQNRLPGKAEYHTNLRKLARLALEFAGQPEN